MKNLGIRDREIGVSFMKDPERVVFYGRRLPSGLREGRS